MHCEVRGKGRKSLNRTRQRSPWTVALGSLGVVLGLLIAPPARAQDPSVVGQWSAKATWPVEAIHMHLLSTQKVMFWGNYRQSNIAYIWDPVANTFTQSAAAPYSLFCSGHVSMANGQLFVAGGLIIGTGQTGSPDMFIYDPVANAWADEPDMNDGRYYPTATLLANGDVLMLAGNGTTAENPLPQVWQTASSTWRNLTTAQLSLPTYPKMFLAPNGKVFMAGQQPVTRYLNTSGTGAWTTVGKTVATIPRDYGPAVMYDTGKILLAGGGRPPLSTAEVIDLTAAIPKWVATGSMAYARRQNNATLLPDGTVLVTGGSQGNNIIFDDYTNPVYPAELWNPVTGTFTTMASMAVYRGYHSVAILLPDGRVLSAGGDKGGANAEFFSPPYLFKGTRPSIVSAPSNVTYGQTFNVASPDAASITQVNWIRVSSVTHTFNQNQRINKLAFTLDVNGTSLDVTAPANSNLCPPGDYLLFILNGSGVPSVASFIRIN